MSVAPSWQERQFKQTRGLLELVSRLLKSVWERQANDVFLIGPQHFDLSLTEVRDKLTETHEAITRLRDARDQVKAVAERAKVVSKDTAIAALARTLAEKLTAIEEAFYQTKNKSSQDPLNYPIRLNNKLSNLTGVVASADAAPTDQCRAVYDDIMRTRGIDWINNFWKALANDPAELARAFTDANVFDKVRSQFEEQVEPLVREGAEVLIPAGGLPALLFSRLPNFSVAGALVLNCIAVLVKMTEMAVKLHRLTGQPVSRAATFMKPSEKALREFLES